MWCAFEQLREKEVFWTHAWHVQVGRSKELCILLTRGNKGKVRQKKNNFSIAPGYCYLAATKEFEIFHCRCIYAGSLWETDTLLIEMLSFTHTCIHSIPYLQESITDGREGVSQATGTKRWWPLFCRLFLCVKKIRMLVSHCHLSCFFDSEPFA